MVGSQSQEGAVSHKILGIAPITTPRQFRRFAVYDLEWYPGTYECRLVGVYDGKRYRCYRSVEAFLERELVPEHDGMWYYAHAGGLSDVSFILEYMLRKAGPRFAAWAAAHGEPPYEMWPSMPYNLRGAFSGSSCIFLTLKRGNHSWQLVDSYWLLRDKLRKIGESIGMKKGGEEEAPTCQDGRPPDTITVEDPRTGQPIVIPAHHRVFYAPFDELRDYNEQDCVILWNAIDTMETFLIEQGGQLQRTLAACAMHLFRRKYLSQTIPTFEHTNQKAEQAYFASRVEVFNRHCRNGQLWDINSSFPTSMCKPAPGEQKRLGLRLPDNEDAIYIARVIVDTRETDLPPIPKRYGQRVFFPVGAWEGWYTSVDLRLLERVGGRILKVYEVIEFWPWEDLREYCLTLYELRRKAEDPFTKGALKLLMNGLYGKFSESPLKQSLIVNPTAEQLSRLSRDDMLTPGAFVPEQEVTIPHRHVAVGAHITALSRELIYDYLAWLPKRYYCDTDSFVCDNTVTLPPEWTGDGLGQLKLEREVAEGLFVAPKVYSITPVQTDKNVCARCGKVHRIIKAKGFPRLTLQQFADLVEYKTIEVERMGRIRELMRDNGEGFRPHDVLIKKQFNINTIAKRHTYPDGHTRPWHRRELDKILGGR